MVATMKRVIYLFLVLTCLHTSIQAQQIRTLLTGETVDGIINEMPVRTVEQDNLGITVTYNFSKVGLVEDPLYPGSILWSIPGFSHCEESGKPSLPMRGDIVNVPGNSNPRVYIINSSYVEYTSSAGPARPPLSDDNYEGYSTDNVKPIDNYNGYFPDKPVELGSEYVYRGNDFVSVKVCPMQYSVSTGKIRIYKTLKYRVDFNTSPLSDDDVSAGSKSYISKSDYMLANMAINSDIATESSGPIEDTLGYLIITTPEFVNAANRLAEWKQTTGYNTYILCRSGWTSKTIKSEVRNVYNNNPSLYSITILGDHSHVPAEPHSVILGDETYNYLSDYNYGCITDDNHIMPDLLRGRISVSTPDEADVVISKIIDYESGMSDTQFYGKGLHCAYFQDKYPKDGYADRRFAQTSEEILAFMSQKGKDITRVYTTPTDVIPLYWNKSDFSNGEEIPDYLKKPEFKWDGKASDISAAINDGVGYVLHRDHGSQISWLDPYYSVSNIKSLSNGRKLPVVFSLNCQTGMMSNSVVSFAETFLRHDKGGCAGIIAATNTSFSGYNDEFAIEMFNTMYPESPMNPQFKTGNAQNNIVYDKPMFQMGQIMDHGLSNIGNRYGGSWPKYSKYTRELFHCFGDPTMYIFMEKPGIFSNVIVSRSNNVRVSLPSGETARISFYDEVSGTVRSYIGNSATFTSSNPEKVTVSVITHNKIPYIDYGKDRIEYIQNEEISGIRSYSARSIKVGNHVTDDKAAGDVVFKEGSIKLKANEVELNEGTSINVGTEFVIETY